MNNFEVTLYFICFALEQRKKISDGLKGRNLSEEHKRKVGDFF